jgi:hypothetical protein
MAVYLTKEFARFSRKAGFTGAALLDAATAVMTGHSDSDLRGGVFKQRVARKGAGKFGGFRTILVFRAGRHCFFVYGFAKSDQANVSSRELKALKRLATVLLDYGDPELSRATAMGELIEVLGNVDEDED